MEKRTTYWCLGLVCSALSLTACGGGDETTGNTTSNGGTAAVEYYSGEASAALGAEGNQASCATCHSNDGTQAGFPGNTFKDIAYHDSFKGGGADLRGAINACVTGWMGGTELGETDEGYLKLKEYMESISSATATAANMIAPEVLADEAAYETAYTGGDATAGDAKYAANCARCHDAGLKVGLVPAPAMTVLQASTIGRIGQQVRTSGPPPSGMNDPADSTPGPMPFFEPNDLSAADLTDIIAHVKGI